MPNTEFIANGLAEKTVGLMLGAGGIGKSTLAIEIAMCAADTSYTLSLPGLEGNIRGQIGYINVEDPNIQLEHKIKNILNYFVFSKSDKEKQNLIIQSIKKNLTVKMMAGSGFCVAEKKFGNLVENNKWVKWLTHFAKNKRLVIIDTLSRIHKVDENGNGDMANLLQLFENIAQKTGTAFLILHHISKSAFTNKVTDAIAARGATALVDNARFVMQVIEATKDDVELMGIDRGEIKNIVKIIFSKTSYSEKPINVYLKQKNNHILDIE